MTKEKFKKLKVGDTVISKFVPTDTYVISKKHKDGSFTVTHSVIMSNPKAWALVKGNK